MSILICMECDSQTEIKRVGDVHMCPDCRTVEGATLEMFECPRCHVLGAEEDYSQGVAHCKECEDRESGAVQCKDDNHHNGGFCDC